MSTPSTAVVEWEAARPASALSLLIGQPLKTESKKKPTSGESDRDWESGSESAWAALVVVPQSRRPSGTENKTAQFR